MGGKYVLPFAFKNETGTRTSHHLIFVSKHPLGYGIMKEIMAKESSRPRAGRADFEYNPADNEQPLLFGWLAARRTGAIAAGATSPAGR